MTDRTDRTDDTADTRNWFRPDVRRALHEARDFNLAGDGEINSDLRGLDAACDCDDCNEEEDWTLVLPGDPLFNLLTDLLGDLLRSGPFPEEHTAKDCERCPVRSRCPGSKAKG